MLFCSRVYSFVCIKVYLFFMSSVGFMEFIVFFFSYKERDFLRKSIFSVMESARLHLISCVPREQLITQTSQLHPCLLRSIGNRTLSLTFDKEANMPKTHPRSPHVFVSTCVPRARVRTPSPLRLEEEQVLRLHYGHRQISCFVSDVRDSILLGDKWRRRRLKRRGFSRAP